MSWLERIERDYIIRTGDGLEYRPQWVEAQKIEAFNISRFAFPNQPGELIDKREPLAQTFRVKVFFTGDDNIDQVARFQISSRDKRPWQIVHPFYDSLTVQPTSIVYNDIDFNVTQVTIELLETLTIILPSSQVQPENTIIEQRETVSGLATIGYDQNIETIDATEANRILGDVSGLETTTLQIINDDQQAFDFLNLVATAEGEILNALQQPQNFLRRVQDVIEYPFQVFNTVKNRVDNLVDQFRRVTTSLGNVLGLNKPQKAYYEAVGASFISTLCASSVTNVTEEPDVEGVIPDYETVQDVRTVIANILTEYNQYIANLDAMETEKATEPDSFVANPDTIFALQQLVTFTCSQLFEIALQSSVEQQLILEADTNAIELTHRVYGLDADDFNLERLIRQNSLSFNELLTIKKDRVIRYYT